MKVKDMPMTEATKMPPSMSIESSDVKELNDYDVGDTMQMSAKCKMTSKDMIDEKDPKKGYRCRMIMSSRLCPTCGEILYCNCTTPNPQSIQIIPCW